MCHMNQKQIGIILVIIGLLVGVFVYIEKVREDMHINAMIKQTGTCFLSDGTCLHANQNFMFYIFGWILSAALIILGVYLVFFDKTQQILAEHQLKVSSALHEAKKQEKEKDEFHAFLGGFKEEEKTILESIHEQDGILQSTLRYRTGMSKTGLSLLLKSLEEREIISRKSSGKSNKVFLRKKF